MVTYCERDGTRLENKETQVYCKFDSSYRCFWSSCDYVDFKGVVRVCGHHPNKLGRFTRRKVSPVGVF